MGNLLLGSWKCTLASALVLIGLAGILVWGIGRLHPGTSTRPAPSPQLVHNPFAQDPNDKIDAAEAARVLADYQRDGDSEVQALERGDSMMLQQSTAGAELVQLRKVIAGNDAAGVTERDDGHPESVVVGIRPDPSDQRLRWMVEEKGTGTVTYVAKSDGHVVRTERLVYDYLNWLVRGGPHYLIADVGGQGRQVG